MANDNKDRFGEKLRDAEKAREDEYFARRDRELLEKIRKEQAAGETATDEKKGER